MCKDFTIGERLRTQNVVTVAERQNKAVRLIALRPHKPGHGLTFVREIAPIYGHSATTAQNNSVLTLYEAAVYTEHTWRFLFKH